MVNSFGRQNPRQVAKADRKEIRPGDIEDGVTVSQDSWTELFVETSENTKRYAPGYGTGDRRSSDAGYSDFDLQSGSGAINGDFRYVLYESSDHDVPLVISEPISANAQRNSVTESLTDKQLFPGRTPRADQDRDLVLEFKADAESDAETVSVTDCTADSGLPYSLYRV
jgi:hypothetical protein